MTDKEVTEAYSHTFDKTMTNPQLYMIDEWKTLDSGERIEYPTGMHRDVSGGKPRFDLLLPEGVPFEGQMLTRWAGLLARGAEKYEARNWELASSKEEYERFKESAFRHLIQWFTGDKTEDHAAAVIFNITAAEYVRGKLEGI